MSDNEQLLHATGQYSFFTINSRGEGYFSNNSFIVEVKLPALS